MNAISKTLLVGILLVDVDEYGRASVDIELGVLLQNNMFLDLGDELVLRCAFSACLSDPFGYVLATSALLQCGPCEVSLRR